MRNQSKLRNQTKKQPEINEEFDISEWVQPIVTRGKHNDPSKITWSVEPHPKKENTIWIKISFGKEILMLLDNSENPRILPLVHKDDNKRILLIKSANGYAIAHPGKKTNYYFFKFYIKGKIDKKYKSSSDPIFHVKGKNSSSIIEFDIHEAFE